MDSNNGAEAHPKKGKSEPETMTLKFNNMPSVIRSYGPVFCGIPMTKTFFKCPNFVDNFLRTAERFPDETIPDVLNLSCDDGHVVSVHRVVLASSSPYLYKIFRSLKGWKETLVIVSGIDQDVLTLLTEFMYTGQADVPNDLIPTFIAMAKNLQLRGMEHHSALPFGYLPDEHLYYKGPEHFEDPSPGNHRHPLKRWSSTYNLSLLASVAGDMPPLDVPSPTANKRPFSRVPLKMEIKSQGSRFHTRNKENYPPTRINSSPYSVVHVSNPFSQVNNNLSDLPERAERLKSEARQPVARRSSITSCQEDFSKWKQQLGDRRKRLSGALLQSAGGSFSASRVKIEANPKSPPSTSSSPTFQPSTSSSSKKVDYPTCQPSTSSGACRYPSPPSSFNCRPSTSTAKDDAYLRCKPSTSTGKTSKAKKPKRKSAKSANWKSRQPMQCEECKKFFSNKFNLKQHVYNMHREGTDVECTECHKMVKNAWYLRRHMVAAHNAPLKEKNKKKSEEEEQPDFSDEETFEDMEFMEDSVDDDDDGSD